MPEELLVPRRQDRFSLCAPDLSESRCREEKPRCSAHPARYPHFQARRRLRELSGSSVVATLKRVLCPPSRLQVYALDRFRFCFRLNREISDRCETPGLTLHS